MFVLLLLYLYQHVLFCFKYENNVYSVGMVLVNLCQHVVC